MIPKLLVISNGHGEDVIAIKIIGQLQALAPSLEIKALPLVGEGHGYQRRGIPLLGPAKTLPSGGFLNMDAREFWRDLRGGLLGLTSAQYQAIAVWSRTGGTILAVGDIVPLGLAWLSGLDYAFVGTAKSDYYLRDHQGWLASATLGDQWLGSVYYPWEQWLMKYRRCLAVFPRDRLTHQTLQTQGIKSYDLGNPMMDGLVPENEVYGQESLTLLLLPGSRLPEATQNWKLILEALDEILAKPFFPSLRVLAAIAPSLPLDSFIQGLEENHWSTSPVDDPQGKAFKKGQTDLILGQHFYPEFLHQAQAAIAMAGTATEQFVGLGKPVVSIIGKGPQFNRTFARRQTHLLGESVTLVEHPKQVAETLAILLQDSPKLERLAMNGRQRLGPPGAALRIAQTLLATFPIL